MGEMGANAYCDVVKSGDDTVVVARELCELGQSEIFSDVLVLLSLLVDALACVFSLVVKQSVTCASIS